MYVLELMKNTTLIVNYCCSNNIKIVIVKFPQTDVAEIQDNKKCNRNIIMRTIEIIIIIGHSNEMPFFRKSRFALREVITTDRKSLS